MSKVEHERERASEHILFCARVRSKVAKQKSDNTREALLRPRFLVEDLPSWAGDWPDVLFVARLHNAMALARTVKSFASAPVRAALFNAAVTFAPIAGLKTKIRRAKSRRLSRLNPVRILRLPRKCTMSQAPAMRHTQKLAAWQVHGV